MRIKTVRQYLRARNNVVILLQTENATSVLMRVEHPRTSTSLSLSLSSNLITSYSKMFSAKTSHYLFQSIIQYETSDTGAAEVWQGVME